MTTQLPLFGVYPVSQEQTSSEHTRFELEAHATEAEHDPPSVPENWWKQAYSIHNDYLIILQHLSVFNNLTFTFLCKFHTFIILIS